VASGVCACGAIITATPAIAITPAPVVIPAQYPGYQAWSPGNSKPFDPAEPDPTFDGPAALYSATASTTHFVRHVVSSGGAAPTAYLAGPGDFDLWCGV
jgi:hypothetical protein